jgi:hypothetical protein
MTRFDPAVIVCYVNTIELYISSSFTIATILLLRNDINITVLRNYTHMNVEITFKVSHLH